MNRRLALMLSLFFFKEGSLLSRILKRLENEGHEGSSPLVVLLEKTKKARSSNSTPIQFTRILHSSQQTYTNIIIIVHAHKK